MEPPTNHILLGPLKDVISAGDCVAFLGAGVSMPDYPDWRDLVAKLAKVCGVQEPPKPQASLKELAEQARRTDEGAYWDVLHYEFQNRKCPETAYRYHMLARIPFKAYLTTNFDPLILDILKLHRNIAFCEYPWLPTERLCESPGVVFYLHGRMRPSKAPANHPEIILTESDFKEAYDGASKLPHLLNAALTEHDVCFLGCGLQDDTMANIFATCEKIRAKAHGGSGQSIPRWFALVEEGWLAPHKFEDTGIDVLRYPRMDHTYVGLTTLLEHLAGAELPRPIRPENRKSTFESVSEVQPQ